MSNNNFLKELDTPEGIQKVVDTFLELEREQKERDEKSKKLVSDDEYMLWLLEFTKKYPTFYSDMWKNSEFFGLREVQDKVLNLRLFYNAIDLYAKNNYIYPGPLNQGVYYLLKYKDFGFKVAHFDDSSLYGIEKVGLDEKKNFIDFEDIKNNKNLPNKKDNDERIKLLETLIITIASNGLPLEAITERTEQIVKNICVKRIKDRK